LEWKHPTSPAKENSKLNRQQEKWCWQFFGICKGHQWNIIKRGAQQKTVTVTMRCCMTSRN
jgi:hypothetical protein